MPPFFMGATCTGDLPCGAASSPGWPATGRSSLPPQKSKTPARGGGWSRPQGGPAAGLNYLLRLRRAAARPARPRPISRNEAGSGTSLVYDTEFSICHQLL